MTSTFVSLVTLRRIGVVALAAAMAGTGFLVILHLNCAHGGAGEISHQDCKICKKFSQNSAVPVLTYDVPSTGPSLLLDTGSESTAETSTVFRPGVRAPPARFSVS